jgi:hypothetical protein
MHGVEYSLTLSRPCRRSLSSIFHRSGRKSDRIGAASSDGGPRRSLAAVAANVRRKAHTPLTLISDAAYEAGLARLRAASTGPVIDVLDMLVLHNAAH